MSRLLFVCRTWAVCCGADGEVVKVGGIGGLPKPVDRKAVRGRRREARVHLWRGREVVCGQKVGQEALTEAEGDVTCGNCLRALERAGRVEISQPVGVPVPAGSDGRVCRVCEVRLGLDAFARDRQDWAGRKRICRECDNRRRREHSAAKRGVEAA